MPGGLRDAGPVLPAPCDHGGGVLSHWTAEAFLPPVRPACGLQSGPSGGAASLRPLLDPLALHVRDLGQNGEDQLPDAAATNGAEPVNVHGNALVDKEANGGLNVQCVPAEAVNRIDMNRVARPNLA